MIIAIIMSQNKEQKAWLPYQVPICRKYNYWFVQGVLKKTIDICIGYKPLIQFKRVVLLFVKKDIIIC